MKKEEAKKVRDKLKSNLKISSMVLFVTSFLYGWAVGDQILSEYNAFIKYTGCFVVGWTAARMIDGTLGEYTRLAVNEAVRNKRKGIVLTGNWWSRSTVTQKVFVFLLIVSSTLSLIGNSFTSEKATSNLSVDFDKEIERINNLDVDLGTNKEAQRIYDKTIKSIDKEKSSAIADLSANFRKEWGRKSVLIMSDNLCKGSKYKTLCKERTKYYSIIDDANKKKKSALLALNKSKSNTDEQNKLKIKALDTKTASLTGLVEAKNNKHKAAGFAIQLGLLAVEVFCGIVVLLLLLEIKRICVEADITFGEPTPGVDDVVQKVVDTIQGYFIIVGMFIVGWFQSGLEFLSTKRSFKLAANTASISQHLLERNPLPRYGERKKPKTEKPETKAEKPKEPKDSRKDAERGEAVDNEGFSEVQYKDVPKDAERVPKDSRKLELEIAETKAEKPKSFFIESEQESRVSLSMDYDVAKKTFPVKIAFQGEQHGVKVQIAKGSDLVYRFVTQHKRGDQAGQVRYMTLEEVNKSVSTYKRQAHKETPSDKAIQTYLELAAASQAIKHSKKTQW